MTIFEIVLVLTLTALVTTWLVKPLLVGLSSRSGWLAQNYCGSEIPSSGGLMVLPGLSMAWLVYLIISAFSEGLPSARLLQPALIVVWGFALLGFLDDRGGEGEHGGFAHHFRTLLSGQLTTGGAKALGGAILALLASFSLGVGPFLNLVNAVLIALCANLVNLIDTRPGRAIKGFIVLVLPALIVAFFRPGLAILIFPVVGAVVLVGLADLRAELMLGDTGANLLGAIAGLALASIGSWVVTLSVLALVAGINLITEKVSLSSKIDESVFLSWLDRLGRRDLR